MDLLPQNAERLCNWKKIDLPIIPDNAIYSRSVSHTLKSITFTLLLVITLLVINLY